ncbi:hypothetical protein CSB09_03890 [Candidatus Gracilibacteria bacterium]|nr:MAG: hypothetical protein CSB09_03890 [Candidatus Gracilibacteria bacterium]
MKKQVFFEENENTTTNSRFFTNSEEVLITDTNLKILGVAKEHNTITIHFYIQIFMIFALDAHTKSIVVWYEQKEHTLIMRIPIFILSEFLYIHIIQILC